MSKALDKIKKIAINEDYSWLDEAKVRQKNKAWRKRSFQIAARILVEIRRQKPINGMTQKMLAEKMGVAPQYINKVVKGKENLTLDTIAKFEEVLGIRLINITEPKVQYDLETQDFADDQKITNYQEAYDSSKGYFYKIFKFNQEEDFKYPIEDDSFLPNAKLIRNELLDKLSSYCLSIQKGKFDLKENEFSTYLYEVARSLLEIKKNELPFTMPNETIKIVWNPDKSKISNWEKYTKVRYSEKNKYEHEG